MDSDMTMLHESSPVFSVCRSIAVRCCWLSRKSRIHRLSHTDAERSVGGQDGFSVENAVSMANYRNGRQMARSVRSADNTADWPNPRRRSSIRTITSGSGRIAISTLTG